MVYNRISGRRLWSMAGYSLLENPRFQFEIYARSVDELRTVYTTVLSALVATALFKSNPIDSPDDYWVDETQTYMRMFDVSIWNQER